MNKRLFRRGSWPEIGLVEKITSYDDDTNRADVNVVNQVEFAYNYAGLPVAEYQEHEGVVSTSTSLKVQYFYDETVDAYGELTKGLRLKQIVYPNGRKLRYEYNGGDDSLGRVSFLADDSSGSVGTHLAEYTRLGLGQAVRVDYHKAGASDPVLSYNLAFGTGADPYDGLDAFGRVQELRWHPYADSSSPVVQIKHGHDRASNRRKTGVKA